jgi:hypothetical protein
MSRLDRLKEQHPELNTSVMDIIVKLDPTKTYKYTEFLVKKFKEFYNDYDDWMIGLGMEMMGSENMESLNEFEIHAKANRIVNPDISQYKGFGEIQEAVIDAKEKVRLKELEKQVIKLFDNDEWSVVIPLSYEASKTYGAKTKWCTTQERYWEDYHKTYKLIYIQNKKTNEKYAVSRHFEDSKKIQAWMSNDDETSPMLLPLPPEVMSVVICEVNKTETIMELQSKHEVNVPTVSKKETITLQGIDPAVIGGFDDYFGQYLRTDIDLSSENIGSNYSGHSLLNTNSSSSSMISDMLRRLERGGL